MRENLRGRGLRRLLLVAMVVTWMTPIAWTLLTSLKQPTDIFAPKPIIFFEPTFENYGNVIGDPGFWRASQNSVLYAIVGGGLGVLISIPAAFALARSHLRFRSQIAFAILCVRMVPAVAILLPFYVIYREIGFLDTHLGMLIVHIAGSIPIAMWLLWGFIEEIPVEIEEAAMVDGCTRFQALRKVVVPLLLPGLAATGVFVAIFAWNDFVFAAFLTTEAAQSGPAFMSSTYQSLGGTDWGRIASASMVYSAPLLLAVFLLQRHLVKGLSYGAIR